MLFSFPLMSAVQEISARIGRVTGRGLAGNISRVLLGVDSLSDRLSSDCCKHHQYRRRHRRDGRGASTASGGSALLYAILFAVLCVVLQVFIPYTTYSCYLKWLTLVLFSLCRDRLCHPRAVEGSAAGTFIPSITNNGNYWATFIAILGTTISPYLFFWQASQETEEIRDKPEDEALKRGPSRPRAVRADQI